MVVWPKHVVGITSEEEKRNCCVDAPYELPFMPFTEYGLQ
jgi:hypothetical protein